MKIINARIKNVTVGLDAYGHLVASTTFEAQDNSYSWEFDLTDVAETQRLTKLMIYAGTDKVNCLEGRVVRVAVVREVFLRAFGDPIQDTFISLFGGEYKETIVAQIKEYEEQLFPELKIE